MESYFNRATNPRQYDEGQITWKAEGAKDSPTRNFYYEYLLPNLDVKDKTVVDIGSGLGPLFPYLKELGAKEIIGIEPSLQNVEVARELYPEIAVLNSSLESAEIQRTVDVAISVMVFEHIADLDGAFKKISSILQDDGRFYLIAADKDYFLTPRFDYTLSSEKVDDTTIAIKTGRNTTGVMYDLVRPTKAYIDAAARNGLALERGVGLTPTEALIKALPKYEPFVDRAIGHLFIFRKEK